MRGTFKGIEVKCRGGEQAHRRVGSLKLLQDLHNRQKLSDPLPLRFFVFFASILLMWCCFYETYSSWVAAVGGRVAFAVREIETYRSEGTTL